MTDKDVLTAQLQDENRQVRETMRRLEEQIAWRKKNSGNSSKPPSSDIVKPPKPAHRRRKKRKRGGQPGYRKHTRVSFPPEQVDQVIEYELRAAEDYFRFLSDPAVNPTNNSTERDIRHTVIDRRVTQGTRGQAGMQWCARIWTTLATCTKQQRNVFDLIHQCVVAHWTRSSCPTFL